ncbi:MAG: transglycosylase domain-containing protein, partial [Bacteriovorax sp.]|nr:transglycosylase domain-containing protein [Bacteriovorax sp.]
MKQWAIRIFITLLGLVILVSIGIFIFVKTTLSETSVALLEEKISKNYDPYTTPASSIVLEEGSLVKREELQKFFLFTVEKNSFEDFMARTHESGDLTELKNVSGVLQVNHNVELKNLMINDCAELYCYQHYLPFEYIPSIFWKGLIGVEDQRYLDHFGIDFKSLFRALVTNLKTMKYTQGGSTISQQLVKNLFFTNEKTFSRKLKEMIVSVYIETKFPKEKILEAYLNEVHWGALQGIKMKGVMAASLYYFGKKPADITPFEGAILIGLLKGPGYFHPLKKIERLQERAEVVYKKLIQENSVPNDLTLIWKKNDWNTFTTRLQKLEKTRYHQSIWRTLNDQEPTLSNYEKFVLIQKVADVKQKISERFNDKFNTVDISVKVMLGPLNSDQWYSYYSRVERNKEKALTTERHQVGSSIKPIIYSIFEDLGRRMDEYVSTDQITIKLKSGSWTPKEAHKIVEHQITMTEALMKSYNRPVIRVANDLGFPVVEEKMKFYFPDLKTPLGDYPSELLGSMELSMSELRDIYVKFIRTECGKIKNSERFMDQSVLKIMSDPNQTTVERAVDIVMQKLRFFGKTGTTTNGYDNWYVAIDGKNITLIWAGYEGQRKTKSLGLYGATT